MATPNDGRFSDAWRALADQSLKPGWSTLPIPSRSTSLLLAGRHHPANQESRLIGFSIPCVPKEAMLPSSRGFSLESAELLIHGMRYFCLAITRQPSASIEIFTAMLNDIIEVLERTERPEPEQVKILIDRILGWQRFMSREDDGALKGDQEIGLMGELQVLRSLLSAGVNPSTALEWWQGPLDSLHDFVAARGAIEAKASTRAGTFTAKIASLDQLDDTIVQPLYIAAVQYSLSSTGLSLPQCVNVLTSVFEDDAVNLRTFEERLLSAGYHSVAAARYHRHFSYLVTNFHEVTKATPCLTRGNVPQGVLEAIYTVELDSAKLTNVALDEILQRIG
jgi:hypothetical protein